MFTGTNQTIQIKLGSAATTSACPWTATAVSTATPPVVTAYSGTTNGTSAVTVIPAAQGFLRQFMLRNADTVTSTLTVIYNDNSTLREVITFALAVGDTVEYESTHGWRCYDSSGKLKASSTGFSLIQDPTPQLGASLVCADNAVSAPKLQDVSETVNALGSGSGARAIDFTLGEVVSATVTGTTTWSVTNPPASGTCGTLTLILTNGGSATQTWMSGIKWPAGSAPTLTASGVDILLFTTIDGGTTWRGVLAGANFS